MFLSELGASIYCIQSQLVNSTTSLQMKVFTHIHIPLRSHLYISLSLHAFPNHNNEGAEEKIVTCVRHGAILTQSHPSWPNYPLSMLPIKKPNTAFPRVYRPTKKQRSPSCERQHKHNKYSFELNVCSPMPIHSIPSAHRKADQMEKETFLLIAISPSQHWSASCSPVNKIST